MRPQSKSRQLYERARKVMPGPQSNLRGVWQGTGIWKGEQSIFMVKGEGAHLWDADGNEYIDYMAGMGPGILGYGNKEYLQALKDQLDTIYYLGASCQTSMEVEVAEKIVQHLPCAEMVRFCQSGTEAVQLAIRLARAHTKRRYFIRFEGHYHGYLDNVMGGVVDDHAVGKPFAMESSNDPGHTEGRDTAAFEQSFKLPWNDIEVLERVLEKYGKEVAMIHMEPILCNAGCCPPRPGYLERVRELCNRHGIVLSFDEIITGFRVGLNSAQGKQCVIPDIATLGKALGGGIPLAVVAGKREILSLLAEQRVIGAGTFSANPLAMAAALATFRILERGGGAFYSGIDRLQGRLMSGLREISKRLRIPMLIQGPTGVFFTLIVDKDVAYSVRDLKEADGETQLKFRARLLEEGILNIRGRWYVTRGLTEKDVDKTLECAERALRRL